MKNVKWFFYLGKLLEHRVVNSVDHKIRTNERNNFAQSQATVQRKSYEPI